MDSGIARRRRTRYPCEDALLHPILLIHVAAGGLALGAGYVALFAVKGGTVHRKSGTVFVVAMLVMAMAGLAVSTGRGIAPAINVPAALLTAYLVATAFATVRAPRAGAASLHLAATIAGLGVAVIALALGLVALMRGELAVPQLLFGIVASIAAGGDIRVLRHGALSGARRMARHLWRMCCALLIAALSFFIGQADVIPEALRIYPLLAAPMLVVLAAMVYWLRRTRSKPGLAPPAA